MRDQPVIEQQVIGWRLHAASGMGGEYIDESSNHYQDVTVLGRPQMLTDTDLEWLRDMPPRMAWSSRKPRFVPADEAETDQCEFLLGCGMLLRQKSMGNLGEGNCEIRGYCRSTAADTLLLTLDDKRSPLPEQAPRSQHRVSHKNQSQEPA